MEGEGRLVGRKISPGCVEGEALVAPVRISFWGGFDLRTGTIVEVGNPLEGCCLDGKVLVFLSSKGSAGTSATLGLARRMGHAPAAFVTVEVDPLTALACIVQGIPMISDLQGDPFQVVRTGDWVRVDADRGTLEVLGRGRPQDLGK